MIDNDIEYKINKFLQRNVCIFVEGSKPIKDGKLLLFKFKEFYFNFTLKADNGSKIVELPYPFKIEEGKNHLKFSYMIDDFASKSEGLEIKLKFFKPEKKNKLYNSVVVLSAIEI